MDVGRDALFGGRDRNGLPLPSRLRSSQSQAAALAQPELGGVEHEPISQRLHHLEQQLVHGHAATQLAGEGAAHRLDFSSHRCLIDIDTRANGEYIRRTVMFYEYGGAPM